MLGTLIATFGLIFYVALWFQTKASSLQASIDSEEVDEDKAKLQSAADFYTNLVYGIGGITVFLASLIVCLYKRILTAARMIINSGKMTYQLPSILLVPFGFSAWMAAYLCYWTAVYSGIHSSGSFEDKSTSPV